MVHEMQRDDREYDFSLVLYRLTLQKATLLSSSHVKTCLDSKIVSTGP